MLLCFFEAQTAERGQSIVFQVGTSEIWDKGCLASSGLGKVIPL